MTDLIHKLESQLDALEADSHSDLRSKIDTLNALAKELRYTDSAQSAAYCQRAYKLSHSGPFAKEGYGKGLASSLLLLSIHNHLGGNYQQALAQLFEARHFAEIIGDIAIQAEVLLNFAHTYTILGDWPVALEYALHAVEKCKTAGLRLEEADAYNKLGIVHAKAGNLRPSLDALLISLAIYREVENKSGEAILLNDIAMSQKMLLDFDSALTSAHQSLLLAQQIPINLLEANSLCTIGEIYLAQGDTAHALEFFQKSITFSQELNFRYVEMYALLSSGQLHLQTGRVDLALPCLLSAVDIAQVMDTKPELYQIYKFLAETYKRQGDFATALSYHEQYQAVYEAVFNEESDRRVKYLQIAHDTETAQKEAEIFRLKNVELEQEISRRIQSEMDNARAHKELERSERRYRTLFEATFEGICIHEREVLLDANPAFTRLFGYSHAEIGEMSVFDLIAEESHGLLREKIRSADAHPYEAVGLKKNGTTFEAELLCLEYTYEGRLVQVTALRDITERKKIERQQLALALEQERMQILANFITQASHEFRTPLSVIGTNAYLLKQASDSEKQKQRARFIEEQVGHLAELVSDMVALSKLDSGKWDLSFEEVELNDIIRAAFQMFTSQHQEKPYKTALDLSQHPIHLRGNSDFLRQAIEHILDNAFRYTPEDGVITIQTDRVDNHALIKVTDTGMGISEEALPHIFERFYRVDVAGTTRGLGLGLSIAKAVIDIHQGQIEVESRLGQGSVFSIWLPCEG